LTSGLIAIATGLTLYLWFGKEPRNLQSLLAIITIGLIAGFALEWLFRVLTIILAYLGFSLYHIQRQGGFWIQFVLGPLVGLGFASILRSLMRGQLKKTDRPVHSALVYMIVGTVLGFIFALLATQLSDNASNLYYGRGSLFIRGLTVGIVLGALQWLYIRRNASIHGSQDFWWILVNGIAWAVFIGLNGVELTFDVFEKAYPVIERISDSEYILDVYPMVCGSTLFSLLLGSFHWIFLCDWIYKSSRVIWISTFVGFLLSLLASSALWFLGQLAAAW
jgi:hypothetical protein